MSKQYDGYELPNDPLVEKSVCFEVHVPDDPAYISAFKAQIEELSYWWNWQRDSAHTGRLCARRWYPVWAALKPNNCCDGDTLPSVDTGDDTMEFRQDGCKLQTKCADGSWTTIFDSSQCSPSDQPGNGSHQPQPGGGCASYSGKLQASGRFLVPTLVSTNDTVQLVNVEGAGSDNGISWNCPDGSTFFAGTCVPGTSDFSGSDPLPTAPHMSLIFEIAGSYYPTTAGAVTVPGGVVDEQVFIIVNDPTLSDNAGSYTVDVSVCNNEPATWSHTFDFAKSTNGFLAYAPIVVSGTDGVWVSGSGWNATDGELVSAGNHYRSVFINRAFVADVTDLVVKFDRSGLATDQPHTDLFTLLMDNSLAHMFVSQDFTASQNGTDITLEWHGSPYSTDGLNIQVITSYFLANTYAGAGLVKSVEISGVGVDPFV